MRQWIWIYTAFFICLKQGFVDCESSKLYDLVYQNIDVNSYHKCVRLLNGTNQVGCQSSPNGNVGILFHANTTDDLTRFYATVDKEDYILLVDASLFNKTLVRTLKLHSTVKGLIVYEPEDFAIPDWSPDLKCPTERIGLYSDAPKYSNCQHEWNFEGDGLTEEDIPFPVFYALNSTSRDPLIDCYYKHNLPPLKYPLCAVEMKSWMHGAVDAISCIRRSKVQSTLTPVGFCDVIGGHNIISSLKQLSFSYRGASNSTILVTAPIDSRAFMSTYSSPGVNEATGFIALLGVAYALGQLTQAQKEAMPQNVVFVLFNAEAFDNIGSTRMLHDMKNNNFPTGFDATKILPPRLKLQNISSVIEIRQLGLASGPIVAHFDPISYKNPTIGTTIDGMVNVLNSFNQRVVKQTKDLGLAPSSLHSILKENDGIPGVVLTDYDQHFLNKHYFSRYDNLENIGIELIANATYEENLAKFGPLAGVGSTTASQLPHLTVCSNIDPVFKKMSLVSTAIAKSIYNLAQRSVDVDVGVIDDVAVDNETMAQLLYCYLYKPNCPLLKQYLNVHSDNYLANTTYNRYVSVFGDIKEITNITLSVLAGFTGDKQKEVTSCSRNETKDIRTSYFYLKGRNSTPECVVSSSFVTIAKSASFDVANYANSANLPGMWVESQWSTDSFRLRAFVIQEEKSQGLVLLAGFLVLIFSFIFVWFLNKKATILFPNDGHI